jgi:hypothetical protein
MNRRQLLLAAALFAGAPGWARATRSDKSLIEALLWHIGHLQGARFIRNGSEYDPASAAKYLRHKWGDVEGVDSVDDFIVKVASTSSSSGKPYLIRLADGREQPCGEYLRGVLASLQASK